MQLAQLFPAHAVVSRLQAQTSAEVLEELAQSIAQQSSQSPLKEGIRPITAQEIAQVLALREKLCSTGIGDKVAIPHGRVRDLDRVIGCVGLSEKGIDFGAVDGRPTHIFFALVSPERAAGPHLRALARISRLCKTHRFREGLLQLGTAEGIAKFIAEEDSQANSPS